MADRPVNLPCSLTDKAKAEWEQLPAEPCKRAVGFALEGGFPWYSIGYGPINRVDEFIEWDIPNPGVADSPFVGGAGAEPPDFVPLAYRIYGSIEVEKPPLTPELATAYFLVRGIREVIRSFRFQLPQQPPSLWRR